MAIKPVFENTELITKLTNDPIYLLRLKVKVKR